MIGRASARKSYKKNKTLILKRKKLIRDRNPEQEKRWRRNSYLKNKGAYRERSWRSAGIRDFTVEKYDLLLDKQKGCCAICGNLPLKRRLDVDHDHKTGEVRGLLCVNCNRALGHFKESEVIMNKAIKYLRRSV